MRHELELKRLMKNINSIVSVDVNIENRRKPIDYKFTVTLDELSKDSISELRSGIIRCVDIMLKEQEELDKKRRYEQYLELKEEFGE